MVRLQLLGLGVVGKDLRLTQKALTGDVIKQEELAERYYAQNENCSLILTVPKQVCPMHPNVIDLRDQCAHAIDPSGLKMHSASKST